MRRAELQTRARAQQSGNARFSASGRIARRSEPERDRRHRGERGPWTVNLTSCLGLTIVTLFVLSRAGLLDLDISPTVTSSDTDDADVSAGDERGVADHSRSDRWSRLKAAADALHGGVHDGSHRGVPDEATRIRSVTLGRRGGSGGASIGGDDGAGDGDDGAGDGGGAISGDASRCYPGLARDESWGTYASLPAFSGKAPHEELRELTLMLEGGGTGTLQELLQEPETNGYQKTMKSLTLPTDCGVEAGDAITREEDAADEARHPKLGSCAIVFPSGHLVGSGAGPQIEAHDHVFRLNGHNAPGRFTLKANDFGHRTEFRALSSAAIDAGLKHDIHWVPTERWLLYSGCQHRNPQPWCAKLFVVLRQKPVAGLHFVPQEAHRAGRCLSALKRRYLGPHRRYQNTPTTGFASLLYASRQCSCVTVFGLCNTTNCDQALKWAGHSDKTGWKDPVHDFHLEHLAALLMARDHPERVRLWVSHKNERQRQGWGAAAMAAAAGVTGRIRNARAGTNSAGRENATGGIFHRLRPASRRIGAGGLAQSSTQRRENREHKALEEIGYAAASDVLGDRYKQYKDMLLGNRGDA